MASRETPGFEGFADALDEFLRALRRARGRSAARDHESDELTLSQYHLLEPLAAAREPLTLGELALQAGVSPPTATRALDALVRDGFVERERDEEDRRVVRASLTEIGARSVADKQVRIRERRREIFAALPAAERQAAARVLSDLAAAVEALR